MISLHVGGLRLPEIYVAAVLSAEWEGFAKSANLEKVFGDPSSNPTFFDFYNLIRATDGWRNDPSTKYYVGSFPDGVALDQTLLVGDLGQFGEQLFMLDYRTTPPRVMYMNLQDEWIVAANSVEELLSKL